MTTDGYAIPSRSSPHRQKEQRDAVHLMYSREALRWRGWTSVNWISHPQSEQASTDISFRVFKHIPYEWGPSDSPTQSPL